MAKAATKRDSNKSDPALKAHEMRHKLAQNPEKWAAYVKTLGPERTDAMERSQASYDAHKTKTEPM